jgi:hypothetical protein
MITSIEDLKTVLHAIRSDLDWYDSKFGDPGIRTECLSFIAKTFL